jgi:hypothetical protein
MRRLLNWQVLLGFILISLSTLFYFLHYLIFHDLHHIFLYLIGDIAFVFIQVLLVTLIIDQAMNFREKQAFLKKLNMVIGTFFIEVGTELLRTFSSFDLQSAQIAQHLMFKTEMTHEEFLRIHKKIKGHPCDLVIKKEEWQRLKDFLVNKRGFLLSLLQNPNLLEHESFTNLLWAVFHLTDELQYRPNLSNLSPADYQHLMTDARRAYHDLLSEWLDYMRHLKKSYPFLFSLAVRTNPFDKNASVEIRN